MRRTTAAEVTNRSEGQPWSTTISGARGKAGDRVHASTNPAPVTSAAIQACSVWSAAPAPLVSSKASATPAARIEPAKTSDHRGPASISQRKRTTPRTATANAPVRCRFAMAACSGWFRRLVSAAPVAIRKRLPMQNRIAQMNAPPLGKAPPEIARHLARTHSEIVADSGLGSVRLLYTSSPKEERHETLLCCFLHDCCGCSSHELLGTRREHGHRGQGTQG